MTEEALPMQRAVDFGLRRRYAIILGLCLAVLIVDQATKLWVEATLPLWSSQPVIPGFFDLCHVLNRGAAFGFLNGGDIGWQRWFFVGVALLAMVVILFLARTMDERKPLPYVGLGLIMGGAAGNLVDRVRLGLVIDFLDLYVGDWHWPAFNVADSAITVGAGLLVLTALRKD